MLLCYLTAKNITSLSLICCVLLVWKFFSCLKPGHFTSFVFFDKKKKAKEFWNHSELILPSQPCLMHFTFIKINIFLRWRGVFLKIMDFRHMAYSGNHTELPWGLTQLARLVPGGALWPSWKERFGLLIVLEIPPTCITLQSWKNIKVGTLNI